LSVNSPAPELFLLRLTLTLILTLILTLTSTLTLTLTLPLGLTLAGYSGAGELTDKYQTKAVWGD